MIAFGRWGRVGGLCSATLHDTQGCGERLRAMVQGGRVGCLCAATLHDTQGCGERLRAMVQGGRARITKILSQPADKLQALLSWPC